MDYLWDFSSVWRSWPALVEGVSVTVALSVASILMGLMLAGILTVLRKSRIAPTVWFARGFIEVFRDLPVLVVLVWLFYCLPIFIGHGISLSPFVVAVIGLGLNFAALQAEIFRSGVEAIPEREIEVARTLGFTRYQIARYIIVPQALWRTLAPMLGQAVNTLKLSSLASFISVGDLFHTTTFLIQETYRPLEFYTVLAALYLAIIMPLAITIQRLERRLELRFASD
jgi:polar amino acid transport system permease protein